MSDFRTIPIVIRGTLVVPDGYSGPTNEEIVRAMHECIVVDGTATLDDFAINIRTIEEEK